MEAVIEKLTVEAAIGSRLKARRLAMRLSLARLGELTAIPGSTLAKAEDGEERLAPEALMALAKTFDVSPSWFFEGL